LFQGVVGAVLGLEAEVFPWLLQLGGQHHVLLVHAAGGVVATLSSAALVARLINSPLPPLIVSIHTSSKQHSTSLEGNSEF